MKLSDNANAIFKSRYAFDENEDWQGLAVRIGKGGASVEQNIAKWTETFADEIYNMRFLPGGRILRNIGRPRGTLFNCYVQPLEDSIEEIGEFQKNAGILWSEGGGVGCNASFLRPKNAEIVQKGGVSSGPVSFLRWANAGAQCIETGGSRRAAALAMMLASHPDVFRFINAKIVEGELNCFNISVGVTEEFIDAVEDDADWDLHWRQKVWDTVKARDIWNLILENMCKHAEPGLINWDNLRSNNSYYFDPILSTNPCGEVPLGGHGVCCLGSLVLPSFITGTKNTNWQLMEKTVSNAIRFLDNIIQVNNYVIEDIRRKAFDGRRIGLGIMGLAEYLFAKKAKYGSPEAIQHIERLMRNIRDFAYKASIQLAEEKGSFPKFDAREFTKAHFVADLPAPTRMDIKKYGMRNVTVLAVAPTGTISLLPEVTSSAEPLFSKAYKRKDRVSERVYVHPLYQEILETKQRTPNWLVDSYDLNPQDHFETQVAVQKFVDGAVSKTINAPKGFTPNKLSELLLEYIRDLKGVTLYVDGSREGQILIPIEKRDEARELLAIAELKEEVDKEFDKELSSETKEILKQTQGKVVMEGIMPMSCPTGSCDA